MAKIDGPLMEVPLVPTPPELLGDSEDDDRENEVDKDGNGENKGKDGGDGNKKDGGNGKKPGGGGGGGGGDKPGKNNRLRRVRRVRRRSIFRRNGKDNNKNQDAKNKNGDKNGQGGQADEESKGNNGNQNSKGGKKATEFVVDLTSVAFVPGKDANAGGQNGGGGSSSGKKQANNKRNEGGKDRGGKTEGGNAGGSGQGDAKSGQNGGVVDLTPKEGLIPALVDTGNPENSIPGPVLQNLAKALGADFNDEEGFVEPFDCSKINGASMRFTFNKNAIIDVPLEMMLIPEKITGEKTCDLAMTASDAISLGSPFMQAAYIVFDSGNKRMLLGQAVINTTESAVEQVGKDCKPKTMRTG
ncbi:hypothetical protein CDD83_8785 [Cordyceps sp. RAO-2017]|nr:hypothetical protein CDD83_8785 [Cordyceps sp. RAO-2017]